MKVRDLIQELQKLDGNLPVSANVANGKDTALGDLGEITVRSYDDHIAIEGWESYNEEEDD